MKEVLMQLIKILEAHAALGEASGESLTLRLLINGKIVSVYISKARDPS